MDPLFKDTLIRLFRVAASFGVVFAVQFYLNNQSLPAMDLVRGLIDAFCVGAIHALTEWLRTWQGTVQTVSMKTKPRAGALQARTKTWMDYLPI